MIVFLPPKLLNIPMISFTQTPGTEQYVSGAIDPEMDWNELILSWNVRNAESASLQVQVRLVPPEGSKRSPWYTMGNWTIGQGKTPRTSVSGQSDQFASVDTDTLKLKHPGGKIIIRLVTTKIAHVSLVTACFSRSGQEPLNRVSREEVWGKLLSVPKRCQNDYPNGGVICSPTSVSMILGYWSQVMKDPTLDRDVPTVCANVYDVAWKGTGNWPFNTAYAGTVPNVRAYVSRLRDVSDLEELVLAGFPVATSVSYHLLKGMATAGDNDGHLVVLVGFNSSGDPIFNDPAVKEETASVYRRNDFIRAWANSGNTVYLVYPSKVPLPKSFDNEWLSNK